MYQDEIKKVVARQVLSGRGHPAVEATVITASGKTGTAQCTAGVSVGTHEVEFVYDGGPRWNGKGVMKAVENIEQVISPALEGMTVTNQRDIDMTMLSLCGGRGKELLGGNAVGAVSAAALKAGAASLSIPLYRHIGGDSAVTLPCASMGAVIGSNRYSSNKSNKPTYSWIAYDFPSFSEACHAVWRVYMRWSALLFNKWGLTAKMPSANFPTGGFVYVPSGLVESDETLWQMMSENISACGYEGRIGIHVDVAADSYFDSEKGLYTGLFDSVPRDKSALMDFLLKMTKKFPFVSLEDPLNEDDYEGHAILTRNSDIQIVGDDLFTTNTKRVQHGIEMGSCNTVLLKVNQIGSFSEARDMVELAQRNNYGVMPCASRGEDLAICDYTVGMNLSVIRENCFGAAANRFLEIERELGKRAFFPGKAGLKGRRFSAL